MSNPFRILVVTALLRLLDSDGCMAVVAVEVSF